MARHGTFRDWLGGQSWCFGCTETARDCESYPTTDDQPDSTMEDNS